MRSPQTAVPHVHFWGSEVRGDTEVMSARDKETQVAIITQDEYWGQNRGTRLSRERGECRVGRRTV